MRERSLLDFMPVVQGADWAIACRLDKQFHHLCISILHDSNRRRE